MIKRKIYLRRSEGGLVITRYDDWLLFGCILIFRYTTRNGFD